MFFVSEVIMYGIMLFANPVVSDTKLFPVSDGESQSLLCHSEVTEMELSRSIPRFCGYVNHIYREHTSHSKV